MTDRQKKDRKDGGVSKVKLAVGAASLFLFIIGVKRTFQMDGAEDQTRSEETAGGGAAATDATESRRKRAGRGAS